MLHILMSYIYYVFNIYIYGLISEYLFFNRIRSIYLSIYQNLALKSSKDRDMGRPLRIELTMLTITTREVTYIS